MPGTQLIIALDLPTLAQARDISARLAGTARWLKIGLELFTLGGPRLIGELREKDFKIFLDLKYYDIPHTVGRAVKAAADLGVDILTLHCQGGKNMCRTALDALAGTTVRPLLFGVTVLTSFAAGEMPGISLPLPEYAKFLAGEAAAWGLDGVVCSGREAREIKTSFPGLLALCPGIRPAGHSANDQARVATPAQAVAAGADYLVVGRPVIESADPAEKVSEIFREMEKV